MRTLTKKGYKCFEVGPLGEGCADGCTGRVMRDRFTHLLLIAKLTAPSAHHGVAQLYQSWEKVVYIYMLYKCKTCINKLLFVVVIV